MNSVKKRTGMGFGNFFRNSLAVMLLIDPKTRKITDANPAAENYYGWSHEQLTRMTVEEINILSPKEIQSEINKALNQQRNHFKFKHRKADGSVSPVEIFSSKIEIEGKEFLHTIVYDIAESVKAEQKMRESETRLAQLAEHTRTITWEIDTNGLFTYVSPLCEKLTGYKAEELIGHKHFFDLLPGSNPSVIEQGFKDLLKQEVLIIDSENLIKTKNGEGMWFATNAFPVYDESKRLKGYRGSNIDIDLRKQFELKLNQSHNLLKNLAEQVPGVVYQYKLNPDGSSAFIYASPGMWDIYEVTPEEVQEDASVVFTRIHPDDYDYIVDSINESAKNLTLYHSEFRVILPQQGLRWRQSNAKPQRLDDGSILWHGIITDITERKIAESKLLHFHDLMKYIIEHDRSAVAVHDRDLNYIYVSQSYLKQYNVSDTDIIGKHYYDVFPDLPQKWRDVHQKALKGEVSSADRDIYEKEDGTLVYTRWECRPWYEANGEIGGIVVYTEVINDRIEKELEIKKLNERLEILVHSVKELSSVQSVEQVQDIVVKSARKLLGADGATIVFKEKDQCFYAAEDAISPLWAGKHFPLEACVSGWTMQNKKALVIEDIYADSRVPIEAYRPTFVKSLAMVPINLNAPLGAIGTYWKNNYRPTEVEVSLLQTLADSAALALENIGLLNQLEQKVAELAKSELVKNKMVAHIGDVIVIIDKNYINRYKSPNVTSLFGWKPKELVGKNTWDIIHPDDVAYGQQFLDKLAKQDGATGTTELRYKRKDGKYVWIEVTVVNLLNDKDIHGFLANYHDITGRKKNEQELFAAKQKAEESELFYRQTFEKSAVGVAHVKSDGHFIKMNKTFCEIVGYTYDELFTMNFADITFPDDLNKEESLIEKVLNNETNTFSIEKRYVHKKGHIIWIDLHSTVVRDKENRILFAVASIVDITERIKMQTELIAAKERAEESDRLKSAFLANMSHEIRTPMNSIMGFASLLPEEESQELIAQYANIIVRNSEQLVRVIDDILIYSRLQSKSLAFNTKEFNICDLLQDIKQSFSLPEYQQGVELITDNRMDCSYRINTDYEKIRQVYVNLVSNAFKYTNRGNITIGAELNNRQVIFFVKDTGIGIPVGETEKVFDRFFRGSNIRKETVPGTGLGLSIVKELVELLGGTIWVESEANKGSTFFLSIPKK